MTSSERRLAYLAQTGRRSLTPRQRRRANHKEGRERCRALIAALKNVPFDEVSPGRVTGQGS